jgi:hypothetical protein
LASNGLSASESRQHHDLRIGEDLDQVLHPLAVGRPEEVELLRRIGALVVLRVGHIYEPYLTTNPDRPKHWLP